MKFVVRWQRVLLFAALMSVAGYLQAQDEHSKTAIRPMRQIYVEDQRDRGVSLSDEGEPMERKAAASGAQSQDPMFMERRDAERRQRTRALLNAGAIATAQDFHDAAFVFQHGQDADDFLLAHILATEAVAKGDATSKWIAAATLDRYLQAIGRPQVFGTQYVDRDFLFFRAHRNDLEAIKNYKRQPGMTQEPYNIDFMPDALRLDFCVPDLAQQKSNLKVFEAGKYPANSVPPGCKR